MHKLILLVVAVLISLNLAAQGNSGDKGKRKSKSSSTSQGQSKAKDKNKKSNNGSNEQLEHERRVWDGTSNNDNDGPKPSKNQPAKVRAAFARDYPGVQNVSWSKYRGDWTATFRNGLFTSTAVYHANGERRDTRTPITRQDVPGRVLDSVFRRRPQTRLEEIIKIVLPNGNPDLFRIKEIINGKPQFQIINSEGKEVEYDY